MSDEPFMMDETPPMMTAQQALDAGRHYKGLADYMASLGARGDAARLERQSRWWLIYSATLAQLQKQSKPD
jgi:hypothetical protein